MIMVIILREQKSEKFQPTEFSSRSCVWKKCELDRYSLASVISHHDLNKRNKIEKSAKRTEGGQRAEGKKEGLHIHVNIIIIIIITTTTNNNNRVAAAAVDDSFATLPLEQQRRRRLVRELFVENRRSASLPCIDFTASKAQFFPKKSYHRCTVDRSVAELDK